MLNVKKSCILYLIFLCSSTLVYAEAEEGLKTCKAALEKDYNKQSNDIRTRLALMQFVSKDAFESSKTHLDHNGQFFYGGFYGDSSSNWDQYSQKRDNFVSKYRYDYSHDESQDWLRITTRDIGYKTFDQCIDKLTAQTGIFIYGNAKHESTTDYQVTLKLKTNDGGTKRNVVVTAVNGDLSAPITADDSIKVTKLDGGYQITGLRQSNIILMVHRRANNQPVVVTATVNKMTQNNTDILTIPRVPNIEELVIDDIRIFAYTKDFTLSDHQQAAFPMCVPSQADAEEFAKGWVFRPKSAISRDDVNTGAGDIRISEATIDGPKACAWVGGGAAGGTFHHRVFTVYATADTRKWQKVSKEKLQTTEFKGLMAQ